MKRISYSMGHFILAALLVGCAGTTNAAGPSKDRNRITAAEIRSVDVQNLHEVVQRLRPRWLEVRAPRSGFAGDNTTVVVYLDRTLLGGPRELEGLGPEVAGWIEYVTGSEAAARLPGITARHIEGAIIVHTARLDGP